MVFRLTLRLVFGMFGMAAVAWGTDRAPSGAWQAWGEGDIARAKALAEEELAAGGPVEQARHLLMLAEHVEGDYESADKWFSSVPKNYERYAELLRPAVDGLIHLGRYAEALRIVQQNGFRVDYYGPVLKALKEKPVEIGAAKQQVLPFTGGSPLDPYMPAVLGTITVRSGRMYEGPIRIDTGGEFLHISSARAKELGVETIACQQGMQAENRTKVCWSQVDLRLGEVIGKNVPIVVIESLPGGFEPILGTNLLQRFKAELDYPEKRLVLYPRNQPFPKRERQCKTLRFYMWADHYMFAKGRFGDQDRLNFFIDSGLVAVAGNGRQAAIKVATEDLQAWGMPPSEKIFDPKVGLGIGGLEQTGHLVIHSPLANVQSNFGGVRIHGLLGHAWFRKYVWRMDFDARRFELCE